MHYRAMLSLDEDNHQRHAGDDDVCYEVRKAREAVAKALGHNAKVSGGGAFPPSA
jgi:hypothetical protein